MVHWAQGVRRKVEDKPKFAKYDYGQACIDAFGNPKPCNQDIYGTKEPALYDLKSIRTPIAIFSGVLNFVHVSGCASSSSEHVFIPQCTFVSLADSSVC